jgi:hypothetical protein
MGARSYKEQEGPEGTRAAVLKESHRGSKLPVRYSKSKFLAKDGVLPFMETINNPAI